MASLLNANLPSDDEEDDEYDPTKDPTGEKETGDVKQAARRNKRRRGNAADGSADDQAADVDDGHDEDGEDVLEEAEAPKATPAQLAKKAKVDAIWQQMQSKSGTKAAASAAGSAGKAVSLSSLCRSVDKARQNPDMLWMRNLGLAPKAQPQPAAAATQPAATSSAATPSSTTAAAEAGAGPSSSQPHAAVDSTARSAAAAALAAAKEAASVGVSRSYNKVQITETRRFAGQDIEVKREVEAGSKEAAKAAERKQAPASGLDAFLAEIEKKKKVSVLDKSKQDWQEYKKTDASVEEELEAYKKSSDKYLDKVDFLKRSELREYEQERDKRLASDVRTRGRL